MLERPWHAQYVLGNVRKDEVGGDRRYLVQARLAKLPLDVVLRRESVTAVAVLRLSGESVGGNRDTETRRMRTYNAGVGSLPRSF